MTHPQVTDEEVEAAARTLDPVAFFSRQEVLDSDECNCGECDRWREIRREAALTNARAALQAAAEVRQARLMPIYGATEPDDGPDVLGERKGEE